MTELFNSAMGVIEKNIVNFLIMIVAFLVISLVVAGVFSVIINLIFVGFLSYLINGIEFAVVLVILAWYIASLAEISKEMINNNSIDYVKSIKTGLNNIKKNSSALIVIAALGFVGGFIVQSVFGYGFINPYNFGGSVIEGIFYALAVGIALSEFVGKSNGLNFTKLFDKINKVSPNSGITLYIITIISIIPGIVILQFLLVGLPVVIIVLFNSGTHTNTTTHKKETENKNNKTQK